MGGGAGERDGGPEKTKTDGVREDKGDRGARRDGGTGHEGGPQPPPRLARDLGQGTGDWGVTQFNVAHGNRSPHPGPPPPPKWGRQRLKTAPGAHPPHPFYPHSHMFQAPASPHTPSPPYLTGGAAGSQSAAPAAPCPPPPPPPPPPEDRDPPSGHALAPRRGGGGRGGPGTSPPPRAGPGPGHPQNAPSLLGPPPRLSPGGLRAPSSGLRAPPFPAPLVAAGRRDLAPPHAPKPRPPLLFTNPPSPAPQDLRGPQFVTFSSCLRPAPLTFQWPSLTPWLSSLGRGEGAGFLPLTTEPRPFRPAPSPPEDRPC
ncbi:proline-rich protein HaeIII subfamily 1-like [Vombatus ursinus]|uniref:proline-rich protein HaeIII subfamily 1-like n=1 Tax=Vombatus ursinus TaxID=29139 RepID=UPI000FFD5D91|nr:proline-rich protein HaeIII subfamily 1-like [Vombatus ursinus]